MTKRIIAVLLCLLTIVGCMAGCATYDENEDKGQCLTMYLTQDLYDLDPMYAYNNESAINVVSLLFDTLFKLDENGKVVNSLASGYSVKEDANANEYRFLLTMLSMHGSAFSIPNPPPQPLPFCMTSRMHVMSKPATVPLTTLAFMPRVLSCSLSNLKERLITASSF